VRVATFHRWVRRIVVLALIAAVLWAAWLYLKRRPEDLPWTPLRLDQPIGLFTGRKLAGLTQHRATCLALIRETGLKFNEIQPRASGQCPVPDAIRIEDGQAMLALSPAKVAPSCPVVAGLAMWQWQVVEPAAQRIFGTSVKRIDHYGSFACRRMYGRESGDWSEHATADAIDVSGFTLSDGQHIRVAADWQGDGKKAAFLREVRDGACKLFSTVLSPDYNAQHHDHLHLDQAERGEYGWRACR
jgi:hypothetical protein